MMLRCATTCAFAVLLSSCGDGPGPRDAAISVDAPGVPADASVAGDGIAPLLWVDFAISGCPSGGAEVNGDAGVAAPCTGPAPLSLDFTAIGPTAIEVYLWGFGDFGTSDSAAPRHVFEIPGSYTVSLVVGGPGGTASVTKPGVVVVEPVGLGARCTDVAQCAQPLLCVCAAGSDCPAELTPGLCAAPCATESCDSGVCADLAVGDPADPAVWQQPLCLLACSDDDGCSGDLFCRELHDGVAPGWVKGCFAADLLAPVGSSCRDGAGGLDDARCASGVCWDQGSRGMCSEPCTGGSCPSNAACATFNAIEIGAHCLARCVDADDCGDDPWLACEVPGGPDDQGFTVDETAAPLGYCAPKTCSLPADCGAAGDCIDGFCGPA